MDVSSLMQTIAILAACVVYLAKQGMEYRQRKNGNGINQRSRNDGYLLKEMHELQLYEELKKSRETMDDLRESMMMLKIEIESLVREIRGQKVSP